MQSSIVSTLGTQSEPTFKQGQHHTILLFVYCCIWTPDVDESVLKIRPAMRKTNHPENRSVLLKEQNYVDIKMRNVGVFQGKNNNPTIP
jgi:hypothetical protein